MRKKKETEERRKIRKQIRMKRINECQENERIKMKSEEKEGIHRERKEWEVK